jgi:aminopeptidase-like protein/acyl carrier protein
MKSINVKRLIADKLGLDEKAVKANTNLKSIAGWNNQSQKALIAGLEKEVGIAIWNREAQEVDSVAGILKLLKGYRLKPAAKELLALFEQCSIDKEAKAIYELAEELFPICRSITGEGVRKTLGIIKKHLPELKICEVPTGTKVFDWEVPYEWNVKQAYILTPEGERLADFDRNNLHLVGYSTPVNEKLPLEELQKHLHSIPEQPNAIPYVTSYYKRRWGFCMKHEDRKKLKKGIYTAVIDSDIKEGVLNYGELILQGESNKEVLISTYVCHPSMANNEVSGIVVATFLAKWLNQQRRRFTYRFVFVPETIGSIAYLSRHLTNMKKNTVAGFNITCVGDPGKFSFLPSRNGNTMADKVAKYVLKTHKPGFIHYSFLDRGSDERQYCSPGIDLPVVSIMRSKYGTYPEYHTSLDNLDFITPFSLCESLGVYKECIRTLNQNRIFKTKTMGEPQLGKRGLYPTLSMKASEDGVMDILNLIAYSDGTNSLIDISEITGNSVEKLSKIADLLTDKGVLEVIK